MHGAVSRRGADKKPVQKGRKGGIKGALALTTARTKTIGCEKRGPHGLVKRRVQIVANTAYGSETMSRSRGIEEGVAGGARPPRPPRPEAPRPEEGNCRSVRSDDEIVT